MKDFQIEIKKKERDEFREFCSNQKNITVSDTFSNRRDNIVEEYLKMCYNDPYYGNGEKIYFEINSKEDNTYLFNHWSDESYDTRGEIKTFDEFKQLFTKTSNIELSKVQKDNSVVSKLIVKYFYKDTLTKLDVFDFIKEYEETI